MLTVPVTGQASGQLWAVSSDVFGGVRSYTQAFDCAGVGVPQPRVTQGSVCRHHLHH